MINEYLSNAFRLYTCVCVCSTRHPLRVAFIAYTARTKYYFGLVSPTRYESFHKQSMDLLCTLINKNIVFLF